MREAAPRRPIMRYHGGKWRLAPWIIGHFPEHKIYVEPFGGAASVLMRKARSFGEYYNDANGEVVNVFRVLRDEGMSAKLERLLVLTPFSREEFSLSYEPCEDPVERARRTIVRSFMGFGSASVNINHRTGYRSKSFRQGSPPSVDWGNYPRHVRLYVERLRGVNVENRAAVDIIRHLDGPETLFYIDPPYHPSTRSVSSRKNHCYAHEMTEADHAELAEVLRGLEGKVVLSGYDCGLYRELYADWRRVERHAYADGARKRTEVLWMNWSEEG